MLPILSPRIYLIVLPWLLFAIFLTLYVGKIKDLANCEADVAFQNAAILQFKKAQEQVVNQQKEVDKVADMFREKGYKDLDKERDRVYSDKCEEAIKEGVEAILNES